MNGLFVFRADFCPHCRMMERAGVIDKLRAAKPDLDVTVEDLSAGETELSKSLRVRTIPCFVRLDANGNVTKRTTGSKTLEQLVRFAGGDASS